MKRTVLTLLALSASLLAGSYALGAQPQSGAAAPAVPQQQKLVRVATLNGIDANREFQANVQLLQAQRQAAVELNAAMEKEKDSRKKQGLKAQFDQLMEKLNENNAAMQKAYGFSLTRNYTMVIETSHIYMLVTDEEAAAIEKQQKAGAQKAQPARKK